MLSTEIRLAGSPFSSLKEVYVMNNAMFLKLHGIPGESKSPRHIGAIEISGFTWGNDPGRSAFGGGGGPGKASINDLTVFKPTDRTTPVLRLASSSGQYIREGALTVEELSKTGCLISTAIWKLESILIAAVTSSGHASAGSQISEAITLNFGNYKILRY